MKTRILLCLFLLPLLAMAQEDDDSYVMFETIMLKPANKDRATLMKNMEAHNRKYHPQGTPYASYVWNITNGPNAGWIVWEMGPCTFTDLDSRPSADGHDEDWRDNITPYIAESGTVEYWRRDKDLSHDDGKSYPMIYIRYYEVADNQTFRVRGLMQKMSEAIGAMDPVPDWSIYYNEFRQGDFGRHIATVGGMNGWADLDKDWPFREAYVKAHGEGSWNSFLQEAADVWDNTFDEIWEIMPGPSGIDQE